MIVITYPKPVESEIQLVHSLFGEGLELLHIRKPEFTVAELQAFVSQIGWEFRSKLVLHHYHHLAEDLGIERIHFPEKDRPHFKICGDAKKSTSVHAIENFNALADCYDYAFISPVFQSISKSEYLPEIDIVSEIKKRTNFKTKLIALGGLHPENIPTALESGFDDVALLGTIWQSNNPLETFKKCQQSVLSL
ncbi:thiamine phosphate synthase [Flavobacterium pedocola]